MFFNWLEKACGTYTDQHHLTGPTGSQKTSSKFESIKTLRGTNRSRAFDLMYTIGYRQVIRNEYKLDPSDIIFT